MHADRPPPSLTHISSARLDQRKPTYSHIIQQQQEKCAVGSTYTQTQKQALDVLKRLAALVVSSTDIKIWQVKPENMTFQFEA